MYPPHQTYTVVEVGSAGCVTLRAFRDIVAEARGPEGYWKVIGIDLLPGQAWSLDMDEVKRSMEGVPFSVVYPETNADEAASVVATVNKVFLGLFDKPRMWLSGTSSPPRFDFVFIDGSHGRSCASDFLAIERKVPAGGVVVFHDYGQIEQGEDWQEADREFISVRSYVHRLGLASPSPKGVLRKGWRFVGEIPGSRRFGGDGNSAAVIQRTADPLEAQPQLSID